MTLIYDSKRSRNEAATHVFIVAVDHYPSISEAFPGALSLSSCCASAKQFYEWIKAEFRNSQAPLATIRMLLSPNGEHQTIDTPVDKATRETFFNDAIAWAQDLSGNRDSLGVFLFSGHGFGLGFDRRVLALSDIGQSQFAPLQGAVSFENLFAGLAPSIRFPNMARQQYFFLDAGVGNVRVPDYLERNASHIFAVPDLTEADDRVAPIFSAAAPGGGQAWARPQQTTLFIEALMNCLTGVGSELSRDPSSGTSDWVVTARSLAVGLESESQRLRTEHPVVRFSANGLLGNSTLHELTAPPRVPVQVDISSRHEHKVQLKLTNLSSGAETRFLRQADTGPMEILVEAGIYQLEAEANGTPIPGTSRTMFLYPPMTVVRL
ncbi:hypothetical protein HFN45_32465 [Rhizobium leguminosarum]|nr:hypothetical protein [Rhizobium leguminosarum]